MILEFKQGSFIEELFYELEFHKYLELFDIDIPIIPTKILHPLSEDEATKLFISLKQTTPKDANTILQQTRMLPYLEEIFPFWKKGKLEQFHLFSVGQYAEFSLKIFELEKNHSSANKSFKKCCQEIIKILKQFTSNNFSQMLLNGEEADLQKELRRVEKLLADKLSSFEKEILLTTGLSMIYPYPKEIPGNTDNIEQIKSSPLLSVETSGNYLAITFNLSKELQEIIKQKNQLEQKFATLMNKKIKSLNSLSTPLFKEFQHHYMERKERTYQYALISTAHKHKLTIPSLCKEHEINLKNGRLPFLHEMDPKHYVPLSVKLTKGSSVLFGANMTGKTTALKTIYFHLLLIQMGLPVPATSISLQFPKQIEFLLKSTGNIGQKLSSFGEEIQFFTKKTNDSAYILVDELFHSTNPISGIELSRIILTEFANKSSIFFATSHYSDVLYLPDITLLKMKDLDFKEKIRYELTTKDLIGKTPFELEKIKRKDLDKAISESKNPLHIALHFPLSSSIKKRIRETLKD